MTRQAEQDKRLITRTVSSILIALMVIFGGGFLFIKITDGLQNPATAVAAQDLPAEKTPLTLPDDIPVYKGGSVKSAHGGGGKEAFELIFSLGSIEQVRDFYKTEMAAAGWRNYASGNNLLAYQKEAEGREASLTFAYYAGKATVRVTITNAK
jgi:hypothetical protein